jgi:hypothetical protein
MTGISIDLTGMAPLSGLIGGFVGFPITLSIINISMDIYKMEDIGNRTYKVIHKTETQRFIVPSENKLEM